MKQLYENQIDQTQILDEILTITNISRGLINENRLKIDVIIDTILSINETILNIKHTYKHYSQLGDFCYYIVIS